MSKDVKVPKNASKIDDENKVGEGSPGVAESAFGFNTYNKVEYTNGGGRYPVLAKTEGSLPPSSAKAKKIMVRRD